MNIYLESVSLDEIRNAAAAGLADGQPPSSFQNGEAAASGSCAR